MSKKQQPVVIGGKIVLNFTPRATNNGVFYTLVVVEMECGNLGIFSSEDVKG